MKVSRKTKKIFVLSFFSLFFIFLTIGYYNIKDIEINNIITNITLNKDIVYLAVGGKTYIEAKVKCNGECNKKVIWESENESIASINNGEIVGLNPGITNIIASTPNNIKDNVKVIVTSLITTPKINSKKPFLPCRRYSLEEADLLDKILEYRINEAGHQTRGGVIAAARFLLLEFPYTIKYFNENGRLNSYGGPKVDGEGRYYHKGLYLHESKFKDITISMTGPAIWGCNLFDTFLKEYRPNGFTCSGFVSWTLFNGGFDVGDSGAGDFKERKDDLGDLGEKVYITKEFMQSGRVKVGDLIGRDGHAAVIIGMDEQFIYIAESLPGTVRVVTLTKLDGLLKSDNFDFVLLMDSVYKNDGNYTDMW